MTFRRPSRLFPPLLLLCLAACARTVVSTPLATNAGAGNLDAQFEFWHALPERSAVTNDEALHALFLFIDDDDPSTSYDQRLANAKDRGWLPDSFNEPANLAIQRGALAAAIVRAAEIKGGLMMTITRGAPRYALRELIYQQILPPSTEAQSITGSELLTVFSRLEDFNDARTQADPAAPAS